MRVVDLDDRERGYRVRAQQAARAAVVQLRGHQVDCLVVNVRAAARGTRAFCGVSALQRAVVGVQHELHSCRVCAGRLAAVLGYVLALLRPLERELVLAVAGERVNAQLGYGAQVVVRRGVACHHGKAQRKYQ